MADFDSSSSADSSASAASGADAAADANVANESSSTSTSGSKEEVAAVAAAAAGAVSAAMAAKATDGIRRELTGMDDGGEAAIIDELVKEDAKKGAQDKDDSPIDKQHEAADQKKAEERAAAQKRHRIHLSDIKDLAPVKRQKLARWALGFLLIGIAYLVCASVYLHNCGVEERSAWMTDETTNMNYKEDLQHATETAEANDATQVEVGTYVEHVDTVSIKESKYTVTLVAWFKWQGDESLDIAHNVYFYRSGKANVEMLREMDEGDTHYQLARYTVTSNKVFHTSRFPLEDHQLRIFLEAVYPVRDVVFVQSGDASTINDDMRIAGYNISDIDYAVSAHQYDSLEGDWTRTEPITCSEYITAITIERSGFGLYLKCFMAMYGTSLWVIIMLYICGNHRVDPLGMIPAALFGTVSNIMVGAALLPDALDLGLLEIVNCWGILTILAVATSVIQINRLRSDYGRKDEAFSRFFGRVMFAVVAVLAIAGNFILPLAALL